MDTSGYGVTVVVGASIVIVAVERSSLADTVETNVSGGAYVVVVTCGGVRRVRAKTSDTLVVGAGVQIIAVYGGAHTIVPQVALVVFRAGVTVVAGPG